MRQETIIIQKLERNTLDKTTINKSEQYDAYATTELYTNSA